MRPGWFPYLVVASCLACGAGRLVYLELEHGAEYRHRAQRQHTLVAPIAAQRGEILDASGRVLAGSVRRPSVFVDTTLVSDPRYAAYSLGPVLDMDPAEIERLIQDNTGKVFAWVKRQITNEQRVAFEQVRTARRLNGFGIQLEPQRVYPFERQAAHVVGFVQADPNQPGMAGIELAFDEVLRGTPGRRTVTVDRRRQRLRSHPDDFVAPRDGSSVVLTLDIHLQQKTEQHLRAAVDQFKARWGAAIVLDPHSGEVLAMASVPDYDPAQPIPRTAVTPIQRAAATERLRNRAISDAYEPGSIFKPFIVAPALDAGQVRLNELLHIGGPTRMFGNRPIRDVHPYDALTIHEVISKSSNIGMGLIGARVGNERLYQWVRSFGFGDLTGIELTGEHAGILNQFDNWTSFSTQSIPIGQEISVTAIQVAAAFGALANDGILYKPRIVRGIVASDGTTQVDRSRPIPVRRILSEQAAAQFRREALAETVATGTGHNAAVPGYYVFGKTGTAELSVENSIGYASGAYVGSFVGGAPLNNPRVVAVVSIYWPSGGLYYGGVVAAPAAGAILGDALEYLRVPYEAPLKPPRVTPRRAGNEPSQNSIDSDRHG